MINSQGYYIIIIIRKGLVKMKKKEQKRLVAILLSTSLLMSMSMPVSAEEIAVSETVTEDVQTISGWQGSLSENNRCYISELGERLTGIQTIEGKTYYFSVEGILQTGWQTVDEQEYYFSPETGERYENITVSIEGTEYCFANDGTYTVISDMGSDEESDPGSDGEDADNSDDTVETDAADVSVSDDATKEDTACDGSSDNEITEEKENPADAENDALNISNSAGVRVSDGKQIIDGSYYFYRDGECLKNTWIEDGNKKYYATEDGKLHIGNSVLHIIIVQVRERLYMDCSM